MNNEYSLFLGEDQKACDPNLCYWSEYYFLATLAHALSTDPKKYVRPVFLNNELSLLLKKGFLENVSFSHWSIPRNVKTGQPTSLVLSGPFEQSILISSNGQSFTFGRQIGAGFNAIDTLRGNLPVESREYVDALYNVIQLNRQKSESYWNMYFRLVANLLIAVRS